MMHVQGRTPTLGFPIAVVRPQATRLGSEAATRFVNLEQAAAEAFLSAGPTVRKVAIATARHFGVEPWRIFLKCRGTSGVISRRRFVAAAVIRARYPMSSPEAGRRLGGFHHKTILRGAIKACRADVDAVCAILDAQA